MVFMEWLGKYRFNISLFSSLGLWQSNLWGFGFAISKRGRYRYGETF